MGPGQKLHPTLPWSEIFEFSAIYCVEAELIAAIIVQESSGNQYAARYEPKWKYWADPERWALDLKCTLETERIGQATSHGYMQVMGAVARELGFKDWFAKLYLPKYNIAVGTKKLSTLMEKFREPSQVISAYNAGTPKKLPDGKFVNQIYVDRVMGNYWTLKS